MTRTAAVFKHSSQPNDSTNPRFAPSDFFCLGTQTLSFFVITEVWAAWSRIKSTRFARRCNLVNIGKERNFLIEKRVRLKAEHNASESNRVIIRSDKMYKLNTFRHNNSASLTCGGSKL